MLLFLVTKSRLTLLRPHGLEPTRLLRPWDFSGKNTAVGKHFLLQGIFLTQGSNLHLLLGRRILYHLSYQGSPLYVYYYTHANTHIIYACV